MTEKLETGRKEKKEVDDSEDIGEGFITKGHTDFL